ncbi:MAG: 16S rRNA (cytidine(1402)-2'-O)-methyltransferase [Christensenellaceae bacterium]|jgi:16S rRNA (cytidine1402-2'-O)-methyltransferase|nr:16S rRNA (cytidine(1402)-2'-O)-methyltransferase [Christensenellaceae bacterium]
MLKPKLYLCPTPIGNMEDITLRAIRVLRECAAVYCEDTRRASVLLKQLDIQKPRVSCHAHNEMQRAQEIAERIDAGEAIAYASDAGMPGISDPGERLVAYCIAHDVPFEILPGASASLTALVYSGLPTAEACFAGFLPRNGKARKDALARLGRQQGTVILYESPLRIADTAAALYAAWGERPAVLVRELTKVYEEAVRTTLGGLAEAYAQTPPRGECVLLVRGRGAETGELDLDATLLRLLRGGASAKDAAKEAADVLDLPKNAAYKRALELKQGETPGL